MSDAHMAPAAGPADVASGHVFWQFYDKHYGWRNMETQFGEQVEGAYQTARVEMAAQHEVPVKVSLTYEGKIPYVIDLLALTQTRINVNDNAVPRRIRRCEVHNPFGL